MCDFLVEKAALGQDYFAIASVSSGNYHSTNRSISLICKQGLVQRVI
jgi:hypothetical protein